jgi:hypothetical protein
MYYGLCMKFLSLSVGLLLVAGLCSSYLLFTEKEQDKIKLYAFYTPSHAYMKDRWFLPSLKDDYELILEEFDQECPSATIMQTGWNSIMIHKIDLIIKGIKENWGKVFIHSDVDIQFFRPTKEIILQAMRDKDMVIQRDDPYGEVCAGFFACRGNEKTLKLWQKIRENVLMPGNKAHDQDWLNSLIYRSNPFNIAWDYLPNDFMGGGTMTAKLWLPGKELPIPKTIAMHHANYTFGVDNKIAQLTYVKDRVAALQA